MFTYLATLAAEVPDPADVNWLLSALAQASAALVAIVGGLLVSRYVSLHAEQQAAGRRVADLRRRVAEVETEVKAARLARDVEDIDWFLYDPRVYDEIRVRDFEPTILNVVDATGGYGTDLDQDLMTERLAALAADLKDAFTIMWPLVPAGGSQPSWIEFRRRTGVEAGDDDAWEWAYDFICEHRKRAAGNRNPFAALGGQAMRPMSRRDQVHLAALRNRVERAEDEARALAQERRLAEETFDATRQPEGFRLGLQVLSVLSVLGMGVPVVLMAFVQYSLPWWGRSLTVAVFFVGVALLLRFLFVYAAFLREDGGRDRLPSNALWLFVPARFQPKSSGGSEPEIPAADTDQALNATGSVDGVPEEPVGDGMRQGDEVEQAVEPVGDTR
ncbi:hypothetical protein LRP67_05665 [Nocardioides sp. cx-169]|uniref:hypothetical protein n=1 Tax=Nocardioides sp. cx-169 TaxID=2899080 RepID=UPI001E61AA4A|nr:hypothetical protein [Nocardioides sp. cx-169]MCD4533563.1 hypothetical protein [Nocardioides sp. cx-169]